MLPLTRQHLLTLAAVVLSNLAAGLWWVGWPAPVARLRDWFAASAARTTLLVVLAAAGLWIGIFVVYGFPITGDVRSFFLVQGRAALAGRIPNADFTSLYMPLFPYIMGAVDRIGRGILAIPLFLAACFVAGGVLLPRLAIVAGLPGRTARILAPVALLNGASWLLAIGYQQDEALMFLLTMAALLLLLSGRDVAAGLVIGLGILSSKILFLLTAAALGLQARRPRRFAAGAAAALVPVLGLFFYLGFDPMRMLRHGVGQLTPPNLPALIDIWPAAHRVLRSNPWLNHLLVGTCCLMTVWRLRRLRDASAAPGAIHAVVAVWLGYVLLSPHAPPTYRVLILPFLPILLEVSMLPRRVVLTLFMAYCTALGVQWMFFEDWIGMPYGEYLAERGAEPGAGVRLGMQIALDSVIVASEMFLLALAWRSRPEQYIPRSRDPLAD